MASDIASAPPPFAGVLLQEADAEAGVSLSAEAGWNQTPADWAFLLSHGTGFGLRDGGGRLVASTVVMPYEGPFAWIGMVLVSPAARGRGLASALVAHALRWCADRQLAPLLDATEVGERLYVRLGFRGIGRFWRWLAESPTRGGGAGSKPLGRLTTVDLQSLTRWDAERFGAARGFLLERLIERGPANSAAMMNGDGQLRGYALSRPGRLARQVGPLVAETETDAGVILEEMLRNRQGPVLVDCREGAVRLESMLAARGFRRVRVFTRMRYGSTAVFGRPDQVYLIAGPELG